jgi:hypothetical protein
MNPETWTGDNLDCFPSPEDLIAHARSAHMRGAPEPYWKYAYEKAKAMRARVSGDIPTALRHEHNCEIYYNELPTAWRW